jgi:hypothetical protein
VLLPPTCADIVGDGIPADMIQCFLNSHVANITSDENGQLALEIDLGHGIMTDVGKTDLIAGTTEGRRILEEYDGIFLDLMTQFPGMLKVVSSDADDRRWAL